MFCQVAQAVFSAISTVVGIANIAEHCDAEASAGLIACMVVELVLGFIYQLAMVGRKDAENDDVRAKSFVNPSYARKTVRNTIIAATLSGTSLQTLSCHTFIRSFAFHMRP